MTLLSRLIAKSVYMPSGCLEWVGCRHPKGYGHIKVGSRTDGTSCVRRVHRVAYELLVGPISDGAVLDHLCRNTSCWNPRHLEPVTSRTNALRGISPTAVNATKTHCPSGHPYNRKTPKRQSHLPHLQRRVQAGLQTTTKGELFMTSLATLEQHYDIRHHDYLDKDAEVPLVTRLAFQGDVAIIRDDTVSSTLPIPAEGHVAVRGETGNTHAVYGPGFFTPLTATVRNLSLGVLTVPDGAQVLLSHSEHGGLLIGPGSYVLRRQREQSDVTRLVAD